MSYYYIPVVVPTPTVVPYPTWYPIKSYHSDPISRKYHSSHNRHTMNEHVLPAERDKLNPYRIMMTGSKTCNPEFIKRFMNQFKKYTIVVGGAEGVEECIYQQAVANGLEVRVNMRYNNADEESVRLYGIFSDEKPFKIYILDDDYEENMDNYAFRMHLPKDVDIIVVKSKYYH